MKAFIDLGAYDGDSLEAALKIYSDFDAFYAFEPYCPNFDKLAEKFSGRPEITLFNQAADTRDGTAKLFLHREINSRDSAAEGNSLVQEKNNVSSDNFQNTPCIDFAHFLTEHFSPADEVVLKIDIEGKEYDLLDHLVNTGSINLIDKIFCEWHDQKIPSLRPRHQPLVKRLQSLGFKLTGKNNTDEFSQMAMIEKSQVPKSKAWAFLLSLIRLNRK